MLLWKCQGKLLWPFQNHCFWKNNWNSKNLLNLSHPSKLYLFGQSSIFPQQKESTLKKYWPSLFNIYCSLIPEENMKIFSARRHEKDFLGEQFHWENCGSIMIFSAEDLAFWPLSKWTSVSCLHFLEAPGKGILLFEAADSTLSWNGDSCFPKALGLQ